MDEGHTGAPIRFIGSFFRRDGSPNWLAISIVFVVASVQSTLVFVGAFSDGTLVLPDEADGFLEHYGVWAILVTDPLLLVGCGWAYRRYFIALQTLPANNSIEARRTHRSIAEPFNRFLKMETSSKYVYVLLVIFGVLCWLNNVRQTIDPLAVYGNDVFDAYDYSWGFLANKLNLFSSWVIVYPLVGFLLVSMGISIRFILQLLSKSNAISPNVFHPDSCYGMFNLGVLNVALLLPYFFSYCVIFSLLLTHENHYFSIVAPLIGLTIVMASVSFLTIGPIVSLGKQARAQTYARLESRSEKFSVAKTQVESRFALERVCFESARASPYSRWVSVTVNFLRVTPVVLTVYRLLP